MRDTSPGLRFQVPLRLQGRDSVRLIWSAEEAADWSDETWDLEVRERLRLIWHALPTMIDGASRRGAGQNRTGLAAAPGGLEFLATRPGTRWPRAP